MAAEQFSRHHVENRRPAATYVVSGARTGRPATEDSMRPTTLMTGIAMGECPRWHEDRLWFSDWGAQRLMTVDPDGNSAVVANVPSMPSCVGWLPDGRTLVLSSAEQRLA